MAPPDPLAASVPDEQLWSWVDRDAPELDAHLRAHPDDQARVDSIRRAIRAVAGAGAADRIPETIGEYRIVSRLGSGGMGIVFEAEQPRPRRRVAIKVIRGAWLDDEPTRRLFFREAEVLARLNHPGIAQIHEAGETKEGAPYFVMELVVGTPLDRWARPAPPLEAPSFERRMQVFEAICRAVQHAHDKGVVHRDLKPSNVLVEAGDAPKVLDFGLARIVDPDANVSLTAAVTGRVVGTVRYMSPEQARGLASRVTATSDVYSLGVLLYELLTGRLPHDFDGVSLLEAARKVAEEPIRLPSTSMLGKGLHLDAAWDAIAMHALAKDPAARYASARALADDVRRALEGAPVTARPPKPASRMEEIGAKAGRAVGKFAHVATVSAAAAAREVRAAVEAESTKAALRRAKGSAKELGERTRAAAEHARTAARDATSAAARHTSSAREHAARALAASRAHVAPSLNRAARALQWTARIVAVALVLAFVIRIVRSDGRILEAATGLFDADGWRAVDSREYAGRPLYAVDARPDEFPRITPWDGVRWQGEQPVVRVLGEWYLLEGIEGVASAALVSAIRDASGEDWQEEFERDLFEHLRAHVDATEADRAIDLELRRGPDSPVVLALDVPASRSNHRRIVERGVRERER